jgi:protein SCO1/2
MALLLMALGLVGCSGGASDKQGTDKEYDVRGKVVAVDPDKPSVTLDHEDIPGLMKAMRMTFDVEDKKLLEGLKAGDEVQGRTKRGKPHYILTRLEKR